MNLLGPPGSAPEIEPYIYLNTEKTSTNLSRLRHFTKVSHHQLIDTTATAEHSLTRKPTENSLTQKKCLYETAGQTECSLEGPHQNSIRHPTDQQILPPWSNLHNVRP